MLNKTGTFLFKLLTLILFGAVGIGLGFKAFQLWLKIDSSGAFVRWQPLEGQQQFEHIMYANSGEVWAYTKNGIDYVYRSYACDEMICYQWIEAKPYIQFDPGMQQIIRSGCENSYHYYQDSDPLSRLQSRYPPQHTASPLECVIVVEHNPYNGAESQIYYVLLDNGDVWMWKYIPDLSKEFILFFAFPLAGLIAGILIWYIIKG